MFILLLPPGESKLGRSSLSKFVCEKTLYFEASTFVIIWRSFSSVSLCFSFLSFAVVITRVVFSTTNFPPS